MITETYTDVTAATADDIIALIEADGGTFERQPQPDGSETIVAQYDRDPPPVAQSEFPWMPIARGELGIHEGDDSARIAEYFAATVLGPQPDSVPWCSAFVNFCVQQSGQQGTRSALARSWLNWGTGTDDFVPGCIVVLPRGGSPTSGHVGFFAGFDANGNVRLLGGNQKDSVSVSTFPNAKTGALGKRILTNLAAPAPGGGQPPPAAGDAKTLLIQSMNAHGITDNNLRAGIAAIAGGESGMVPHTEIGYGHTSPERIRKIFGSRVAGLDDDQIRALAANDENFFNAVYGGEFGLRELGNTQPGDGFLYRGRGIFQLTGRSNYTVYGGKVGAPLVDNPEQANDLKIAVEVAVTYMLDRYPGSGGFAAMKAAVGNSIGPPDANKDQLFQDYLASHEFDA